jgi:hypothetical protein
MLDILTHNIFKVFIFVFFPLAYIYLLKSLITGKFLVRHQKIPLNRNDNPQAFWRVWILYTVCTTLVFIAFVIGEFFC